MPSYLAKPVSPRLYRREGAPALWALMGSPRRDGAGGSGDVADLMGAAAGVRSTGCDWSVGPRGRCLSFDGTNGYATLSGPAASFTSFSVSVWVRGAGRYFVSSAASGSGLDCTLDNNPGGVRFMVSGAGAVAQAPILLNDGAWHHVVGVATPTLITLYLDGLPVATAVASNPTAFPNGLVLGTYSGSPTGGTFNWSGQIDDARFYGRALPPEEIAREYAEPFWRLRPPTNAAVLFAGLPVVPSTSATAAVTLGAFTATATATQGTSASASATPGSFTATAAASPGTSASASATAGAFTATASASPGTSASAAVTVGSFTAAAAATQGTSASASITPGSFTAAASASPAAPGTLASASVTLGSFVATAAATPGVAPAALVMAGWDALPLAGDDDPFGIDPGQTFGTN